MVALNFDTRTKEFENATQDMDFAPLPDGEYTALIIKSELKTTKNNEEFLQLTWKVLEGEYANRHLFDAFFLYNPDRPKQLAFNRRRLNFVAVACGVEKFTDTVELHQKPCRLTVKKEEYNGKERNTITKYQPLKPVTKTQPQAAQQQDDTFDGDLSF